ncbi:putative flippase GtrA [Rhizobium flavum]|uniref:Putative flippase GtrA n=2 Tax=Pseudorhizobium flavum TaxID=1335061 RepID=A0A7W9Z4W7_9HYPH|nr:putative flippase GtrA [Pseudorhizobium flavum]
MSYLRFVAVSLFSLATTITVAAFCEVAGIDYRAGLVAVILVTPPMTYLLQKRFTYRYR